MAEAADASTTITAAAVVDADADAETDVTLSGLSCFGSAGAVTDSVSEDVTEEDYRLN